MPTVKITYSDDVSMEDALGFVGIVMDQGRISTSKHGPAFCAISSSEKRNLWCEARRAMTMDTFRIWKILRLGKAPEEES